MEEVKNNKLIFDFMGCEHSEWDELDRMEMENLSYHESWDALMPVIQKISRVPLIGAEDYQDVCYPRTFGMPDEKGWVMFRFNGYACHAAPTLIEAAYAAVVEFIQSDLNFNQDA